MKLPLKTATNSPPYLFALTFSISLLLIIFFISQSVSTFATSTSYASYNGGECEVTGNALYLLDGASVGVDGDLDFTAGTLADKDTVPAPSGGTYIAHQITNVSGSFTGAGGGVRPRGGGDNNPF